MSVERLLGHHVLVTGAGGGIGSAIARRLTALSARLTLAGRRHAPLASLAEELGPDQVEVVSGFDVTDPKAISDGCEVARRRHGAFTMVINNAGEAPSAPLHKTTMEMWRNVLAVDLTGVFNVTQAVLPDPCSHGTGARIINVASTAGLIGYAYVSAYCAAKHGVVGFTRAIALELAKTGVTANVVCPGFTDTPIIARAVKNLMTATGRTEQAALAEFTRFNPQGRLIRPEEVASTVAWLASGSAGAITGQAIVIAGGEVMADSAASWKPERCELNQAWRP